MNVIPTVVYADFETAIDKAVTTVWPGLKLKHVVSIWDRAGGGKCSIWGSASSMGSKTLRWVSS